MYSKDIKDLEKAERNWISLSESDSEAEQAHFFFKNGGYYYDSFLYTLESEYLSNIYEDAFEQLLSVNPDATEEKLDADPELQDLLDQYIMELAKEPEYDVSEFMVEEPDEEDSRVIHLDICLNVPEINDLTISEFVDKIKAGNLKLDETYYRFEI
jgi:hypothetical protein